MSYKFVNSLSTNLSETRRVSCQNKFVKLVHLVGFIVKKFVTMLGHMNVKLEDILLCLSIILKLNKICTSSNT